MAKKRKNITDYLLTLNMGYSKDRIYILFDAQKKNTTSEHVAEATFSKVLIGIWKVYFPV